MASLAPEQPHLSEYMSFVAPKEPGQRSAEIHAAFSTRRDQLATLYDTLSRDAFLDEAAKYDTILGIKNYHLTIRSYIDWLANIPNRRAFEEEFSTQIYKGHPFLLMYTDLDNLKATNTNLGHEAGSERIKSVASMAKEYLWLRILKAREENPNAYKGVNLVILARTGGDEIGGIFTFDDITEADGNEEAYYAEKEQIALQLADDFREAVAQASFTVYNHKTDDDDEKRGTVSIGLGIKRGRNSRLFKADVDQSGLGRAKKTGKNKTVLVPMRLED